MSGPSRGIAQSDIYDPRGQRKYLNPAERKRFREVAEQLPSSRRCFCLLFYYTGLRISEALEITPERIDLSEGVVIIRTLKRRNEHTYRAVPLPRTFLRELRRLAVSTHHARLWSFSRKTGYRIIKAVMNEARIEGAQACPKGLRHGFGIACVQKNVPLPMIAKWMGHTTTQTTAIYLNAVGKEERQFARRIWI